MEVRDEADGDQDEDGDEADDGDADSRERTQPRTNLTLSRTRPSLDVRWRKGWWLPSMADPESRPEGSEISDATLHGPAARTCRAWGLGGAQASRPDAPTPPAETHTSKMS